MTDPNPPCWVCGETEDVGICESCDAPTCFDHGGIKTEDIYFCDRCPKPEEWSG